MNIRTARAIRTPPPTRATGRVTTLTAAVGIAVIATVVTCAAAPARAQRVQDAPPTVEQVLAGAERLGSGRVSAWRRSGHTLVLMPAATLGRPVLWYTEVVATPAGVVADGGLEVNNTLVRFERQGEVVQIRDLGTVIHRRAAPGTLAVGGPAAGPLAPIGAATPTAATPTAATPAAATPAPADNTPRARPPALRPLPGNAPRDPKVQPIDYALSTTQVGALVATLPVIAEGADGALLLDLTPAFATDIPAATGRLMASAAGLVPMAVDPSKSYIERTRARGEVLNIRSHLSFLGAVPALPQAGPQPVSLVLGHSFVFLPEQPMRGRPADPRVGYFPVNFTQYGGEQGAGEAAQALIQRYRLEPRDPAVPPGQLVEPLRPITFYLGRGVPERWRPWLRAGVLQWLPAFEAAGFRNAIQVLDAPSPQDDPDWTEEDVTLNVIRWLPEERANAMGPRVVDPRSGETLSAHIQIWPGVLEMFSRYYWAFFGGSGLDPQAATLPLSTERTGQLLSYIVAHEVGHTLGLLHNQIASTAWGVAQLRDAGFANRFGPNSSIMAYGRFNQAAQPGDGVRQFWSVLGPYDIAAIRYGYGRFGTDAASEARALAAFAEGFGRDRALYFGSEELPAWVARFGHDPRVLTENTGAERVAATRLGVANLQRSLKNLAAASAGTPAGYAAGHEMLLGRQMALLQSVQRLVGGAEPAMDDPAAPARAVPAAQQREAVRYLLGEGAQSLAPYAAPAIADRVTAYGGERQVEALQAELLQPLMAGATVAQLEAQRRADPRAYSPLALGRDIEALVWGTPQGRPAPADTPARSPARTHAQASAGSADEATRRALQRGWIRAARTLLTAWAAGPGNEALAARQVQAMGVPAAAAAALVEQGDDTLFAAWLHQRLKPLQAQVSAAAGRSHDPMQQAHLRGMALQLAQLARIGQ